MTTRLPMKTFCPNEQPAPMRAPAQMCTQCHTRVPSPIVAPASTMAVGWIVIMPLVLKRQRHTATVARRQVACDEDLERAQAFATIGLGLHLATQGADDVVVVERMPEPIDGRRGVVGFGNLGVAGVRGGEFPVLDVVYRDAADAYRSGFTEHRDRALVVLRVSEHSGVD